MTIAPPSGNRPRRLVDDEIRYPVSDGKPMAETEKHRDVMIYCIDALRNFYADRQDVQVSGNNFLYYEQGNIKKVVSPDCYVVFGVQKRQRDSYMVWKENGILPAVVIEITSKKTKRDDTEKKRPLYEKVLRIPEYFLFDPTGDYLNPRFQGFRLVEGNYVPIVPDERQSNMEAEPSLISDFGLSTLRLHSEQLGLDLTIEGEILRSYDALTGEPLLSASELAQRLEAEAEARVFAERRAEAQAQRAAAERQRAEVEQQRAETAEAERARLRIELDALRRQKE